MLTVSSHQPQFLSWAGYWAKIDSSDVHVVLAGVVDTSGSGVNRFKIRGITRTLALSRESRRYPFTFSKIGPYRQKLFKGIRQELMCKRYPFHARLEPILDFLNEFEGGSFLELVWRSNQLIAQILGIQTRMVVDTVTDFPETKTKGVFAAVERHVHQPYQYLAGRGALNYLNAEEFAQPVWVQKYLGTPFDGASILQLIADLPDPLGSIRSAFQLEPFECS